MLTKRRKFTRVDDTKVIPVIPPGLKPLVPLDGGRFTASDLNDLIEGYN